MPHTRSFSPNKFPHHAMFFFSSIFHRKEIAEKNLRRPSPFHNINKWIIVVKKIIANEEKQTTIVYGKSREFCCCILKDRGVTKRNTQNFCPDDFPKKNKKTNRHDRKTTNTTTTTKYIEPTDGHYWPKIERYTMAARATHMHCAYGTGTTHSQCVFWVCCALSKRSRTTMQNQKKKKTHREKNKIRY